MKVIALTGPNNCGKSTTINVIYHLLLFNGYVQVPGHFHVLHTAQKDFTDILTNGKKIVGIVSMGDHASGPHDLKTLLNNLDVAGCDTAICACTTSKAGTWAAVAAYSPHINVPKVVTPLLDRQRIVNSVDSQTLFSHI